MNIIMYMYYYYYCYIYIYTYIYIYIYIHTHIHIGCLSEGFGRGVLGGPARVYTYVVFLLFIIFDISYTSFL